METFVLIPEQLSLQRRGEKLGVVSTQFISRGSRFSPFQGTLRTDDKSTRLFNYKESVVNRLNGRYSCSLGRVHTESWIRYLRQSVQLNSEVNLIETITPGGQIWYEARTPIEAWEELVVFIKIESSLTFTRALKDVIYEETLRALILEVPLDLSTSLFLKEQPSCSETESDESCASSKALGISLKSKRVRSLLPCSVCSKSFDRPSLLKRHMRTHTGEKPHRCECGKAFSTSSSLNTHRRIHSGEKPHQCPICGKRFTASSNLYYHRMTHVKEKPHKCELCGKSFPTPGDLKSHGFIHTGSWPFKCSVCSRGFSKQTNLKNHLFLHTGSKPHGCHLCHKKFALACNFRAHLKTHQDQDNESH